MASGKATASLIVEAAPANNLEAVQRITRRIDSIGERHRGFFLGLSGYYVRLIILSGIAWGLDSMMTFLFIYCGAYIGDDIPMSSAQQGFLAGSVFIGSFVGNFLFGSLSDAYGRRPMFIATLVALLVGNALCGLSWDITSLTAFRMLTGIGLGGELPVASTLVQELVPKKSRGMIIVLLESFWTIGCIWAVVVSFKVAPEIGWRETFYLSLVPVLYSLVIQFCIPESPKWLASVGRYEEALQVVAGLEKAHGLSPYDPASDYEVVEQVTKKFDMPKSHLERIAIIFRRPFSTRTTVLWTLWFGISLSYYAIYIHMPQLIAEQGFDLNNSFETILTIVATQLPGYFSAAFLVECLGRRKTLVIYLMGSFGAALAMGYVDPTKTNMMLSGSFLSFFLLGAWGCVYAYTPENYPTAIRGIGSAYPSGFSRVGAFIGPYLVPQMIDDWNMSLQSIMWIFGAVLMFVSLVVLIFGYEPRGKNIEDFDGTEDAEKNAVYEANATPGAKAT